MCVLILLLLSSRVFSVYQTPLHLATKLKHEKFVQLLLSYKANPSLQDSHGNTPLHYATEEQSINIVKKLVSVMEASDIETRNESMCIISELT